MQEPWWKKLLSYVIEFSIEKRDSTFSETLEITYRNGRYTLCTPNAMYSYEDLYVTFQEAFEQLPTQTLKLDNILVLGLGLGSIPLLLERYHNKIAHYTIVEIDPVVIELAKKYGYAQYELQSSINVVCADALEFVKTTNQQYDLIAVDIFIDDQVPSKFEQREFLLSLKNLLVPNTGLLMYNRLAYNDKLAKKTTAFYEKNFNFVYSNATYLSTKGNKMLLNRKFND